MKSKNIIKLLAKEAGVEIVLCDKKLWGGKYGFKSKQYPNSTFNGYKTKEEAYMEWAVQTFGAFTVTALIRFFKTLPKKKKGN